MPIRRLGPDLGSRITSRLRDTIDIYTIGTYYRLSITHWPLVRRNVELSLNPPRYVPKETACRSDKSAAEIPIGTPQDRVWNTYGSEAPPRPYILLSFRVYIYIPIYYMCVPLYIIVAALARVQYVFGSEPAIIIAAGDGVDRPYTLHPSYPISFPIVYCVRTRNRNNV